MDAISGDFKWFRCNCDFKETLEMLQAAATVMKRKRVSAIFILVVLYLVMGAVVFKSLEQPHER